MPKKGIPASLEWAAAENVILTEFKIADHIADGEGYRYNLGGRLFSKDFKKAEQFLTEHDFPLEEASEILSSQVLRESNAVSLDDLAFPTAQTTAIFFREGVRRIGRPELEHTAFELGFSFGKLIYLIDAFEDRETDIRRGLFNAFQAVNGSRRYAVSLLIWTAEEVIAALDRLPDSGKPKNPIRETPVGQPAAKDRDRVTGHSVRSYLRLKAQANAHGQLANCPRQGP
ncbi:hypothetical protein BH10ACI2_BH10ACI2_07420 [soil metagenome]